MSECILASTITRVTNPTAIGQTVLTNSKPVIDNIQKDEAGYWVVKTNVKSFVYLGIVSSEGTSIPK